MYLFLLDFILIGLGIYAVIAKSHLVKKILGIAIIEYAVNLFLILIGYRHGGIAPIVSKAMHEKNFDYFIANTVDPLPQVLVLTAIVIGLGTLALMVAIALKLYEKYGTFDMSEIKQLRG